jgi:G:T-mismatch repair DNA endonuclease (very short patch repair protein)
VSTREQRAAWWLEKVERHIERAQGDLKSLQEERHKTRGTLEYAWDFVCDDVLAVVNVDSGRLLRTVRAVVELATANETVSAEDLQEAVVKHLLGEDRWES